MLGVLPAPFHPLYYQHILRELLARTTRFGVTRIVDNFF